MPLRNYCGFLYWVGLLLLLGSSTSGVAQEAEAEIAVSERQAEDWAKGLVEALDQGGDLAPWINLDGVFARTFAGTGLTDAQVEPFVGAKHREAILASFVTNLSRAARYDLLRIRTFKGERSALFRSIAQAGEEDQYHEWLLQVDEEGEVRAVDIEVYEGGRLMSQQLRMHFLAQAVHRGQVRPEDLSDSERLGAQFAMHKDAMSRAFAAEDFKAVLAIYEEIPEPVRLDPGPMILAFQSYHYLGDDERFEAALAAFKEQHAGSSCCEIVQMDILIQRQDFKRALAVLDGLDERVGGDPYTAARRALLLWHAEGAGQGYQEIDRGLEADKTLEPLYRSGLLIALHQGDLTRMAELIERAEEVGVSTAWMNRHPRFLELINTDAFKQLARDRDAAADE